LPLSIKLDHSHTHTWQQNIHTYTCRCQKLHLTTRFLETRKLLKFAHTSSLSSCAYVCAASESNCISKVHIYKLIHTYLFSKLAMPHKEMCRFQFCNCNIAVPKIKTQNSNFSHRLTHTCPFHIRSKHTHSDNRR